MSERFLTNWPRHSGEFKVVQMEIEGSVFMIFGPEEGFHSTMIKEFLLEKFPSKEIPMAKGDFDNTYPALQAADWYKVWGAGKALSNKEKRELIFYGRSKTYDIGISAEHLERIRAMKPAWKINFRA